MVLFMDIRVPLSFFSTQDGNAMTLEQKILQLLRTGEWPIILTTENGEDLEVCHNEQELRVALRNKGIV